MGKSLMKKQKEWKDLFIVSGPILPAQENVKSISNWPYNMFHILIERGHFMIELAI